MSSSELDKLKAENSSLRKRVDILEKENDHQKNEILNLNKQKQAKVELVQYL
jgi:hypothetical protein